MLLQEALDVRKQIPSPLQIYWTTTLWQDTNLVYSRFQSIFSTRKPTWSDSQTLLNALPKPKEKRMVLDEARALAKKDHDDNEGPHSDIVIALTNPC